MEKTKVTKAMVLKAINTYFDADNFDPAESIATFDGVDVTVADIVAYANVTMDQIAAKAEKAKVYAAKKKVAGDELCDAVKATLTNEPQTREEIFANFAEDPELSIAKIGARLTKLVKDGVAVKEETKTVLGKKMTYKLAD